jgi:predicted DNA-binding ArsR family transcriptional regulator
MDQRLETLAQEFKQGDVSPEQFRERMDKILEEIREENGSNLDLEETVEQEQVRAAASKAIKL